MCSKNLYLFFQVNKLHITSRTTLNKADDMYTHLILYFYVIILNGEPLNMTWTFGSRLIFLSYQLVFIRNYFWCSNILRQKLILKFWNALSDL